MKKYRNPPNVHQLLAAYTHQIEIQGPERLLILSGQVGRTMDGAVPEEKLLESLLEADTPEDQGNNE